MNPYKTEIRLKLQDTELKYYSPMNSEVVVRQLTSGHPVFMQTYDGHCVIVNPDQVPAIEVNAILEVDDG